MLTTTHMALLIVLKKFISYFSAHSNRSSKFSLLYFILCCHVPYSLTPSCQLYVKRERRNRGKDERLLYLRVQEREMRVPHPSRGWIGVGRRGFHVFELSKWNEASSKALDGVTLMTILFMVACYGCEPNTSMDTPIYSCSWSLWYYKNIFIFFLILIYFLDIFSIQEYLESILVFATKHDKHVSCILIIYLESSTNMHRYL